MINKNKLKNYKNGLVRKNMRSVLGGFTPTPSFVLLLSFLIIFITKI
jgi:hypothetical protein